MENSKKKKFEYSIIIENVGMFIFYYIILMLK